MPIPFLSPIDLNKNELQNSRLQNLSSAPGSPAVGQQYYDTDDLGPLWWNGSAWTNVATNALLLGGQNSAYHLARGNHSGSQTASTISDLATTVKAYTLDEFANPVAAVDMGGQRLLNLPTPGAGSDPATKTYVDNLVSSTIQGWQWKPNADVGDSASAALPAATYANGSSGVGATLTGDANGALSIDTYSPTVNQRVLLTQMSNAAHNGLYSVTTVGNGGTPFVLTRVTEMDQSAEFSGAVIAVENNGATSGGKVWLCTVADSITVGTTDITWYHLNQGSTYIAGDGLTLSGSTFHVGAGTGITVNANDVAIDTAVVVRKYAVLVGDNSSTSITVTHNLGTRDVQVTVYDPASAYVEQWVEVRHATTNTVTLVFAVAPTTDQFRCVVFA